jgi:hypothetical protein
MKLGIAALALPRFLSKMSRLAGFVILCNLCLAAQQPASNSVEAQRAAMRKLSFLAGHWSGPATVIPGPGEPLHLTQTEDVEYKLDGLVLLIEGKGTSPDGNAAFRGLATVAYDEASHSYRFRAYHDGHYLDTELTVLTNGFSWGFTSGPAQIVNTMHLTDKGQWSEVTDVTVGSNPPHRSFDMQLQHQP